MNKIPIEIKAILDLNADYACNAAFSDLDVQRAKMLNIKLHVGNPDDLMDSFVEGKLENIIRFGLSIPDDSNQFQDIVYDIGLTLNIPKLKTATKYHIIGFNKFVKWMGKCFPDFVKGIKENNFLKKYYKRFIF